MQISQSPHMQRAIENEEAATASWERSRSDEELRGFIERHHQLLADIEL